MQLRIIYKLKFYICFFFTSITFANTNVWITNNTFSPLYIDGALITNDQAFINQKKNMWDLVTSKINPLETKKIAWFSRNAHLHPGTLYRYVICVSPNKLLNCSMNNIDDLIYHFDVVGNTFYGSTLRTFLKYPQGQEKEILLTDGLEKLTATFWEDTYNLYNRSWLYLGEVFSSYHFVIDNIKPHQPADNNSNKLSILTYNTQLMPFYAGLVNRLNQPSYRAQMIPIYTSQYDVVILQELFDKNHRDKLIAAMNAFYPYHTRVLGNEGANILSGGVMIFSRYPIQNEDSTIFQNCTKDDCLANKGVIYARIAKYDRTYHVFGTHLQAWDTSEARNVRKQQLIQLKSFIQQKNIPVNQPIFIAGDFNFDERSEEFLSALKILNVHLPINDGYQYSVDSNVNSMVVEPERSRLDYIFLDLAHNQPRSESSKIIILRDLANITLWPNFDPIINPITFTTFDLSDHFPLGLDAIFE